MDVMDILGLIAVGWAFGSGIALLFSVETGELETHEVVWWPITLLKFLYRTLRRSVTEGWND